MRRRINSDSDNCQVIVEQEQELYKDKAPPTTNIANKIFRNFIKSESPLLVQSNNQAKDSDFDNYPNEPEIEFVMTARDRTVEFANTIRSLQGRHINRAVNLRDPKKVKQIQTYSEFMMIAKSIGKNIASTYAKLEKLTLRKRNFVINENFKTYLLVNFLVAKRKSLFDDRPAEIQELTY